MKTNSFVHRVLVCCLLIGYGESYAQSTDIEVDKVKYSLSEGGAATVVGYASLDDTSLKSVVIPSEIESDGKTFPVTGLEQGCFKERSDIGSVTLPSSITSIPDNCFLSCTNLSEITMSEGLLTIGFGAFGHTALEEVALPKSVIQVGGAAFAYCKKLTKVELSEVSSIGAKAFYGCNGIRKISIPESVSVIGSQAFFDCAIIYLELNCTKYFPFSDFNDVFGENSVPFISAPKFQEIVGGEGAPLIYFECPSLYYGRAVIDFRLSVALWFTPDQVTGEKYAMSEQMSLLVLQSAKAADEGGDVKPFCEPAHFTFNSENGYNMPSVVIYRNNEIKYESDNNFANFVITEGVIVPHGLTYPKKLPVNELIVDVPISVEKVSAALSGVTVYSIDGSFIGTFEGSDDWTSGLANGIYIVHSSDGVRKVMVK